MEALKCVGAVFKWMILFLFFLPVTVRTQPLDIKKIEKAVEHVSKHQMLYLDVFCQVK